MFSADMFRLQWNEVFIADMFGCVVERGVQC